MRNRIDEGDVRRVGREAVLLGGAARAILLQVAHPAVGRGVAEHSNFAQDPLKRLRGTLNYVYASYFGTPDEVDWVAANVNRVHERVVGSGYSADDPELQVWVAATLYDSAVQVYEIALGPMPEALQEEFCHWHARFATLLGCPQDMWPASVAEFRAYWEERVGTLEISEDAKRICRDLMYNRSLPWYLRTLLPANRFITAGLLPERLREEYELPWGPRREQLFRFGSRVTRWTYRLVPPPIRRLPSAYYMYGVRKSYKDSTSSL